MHAIVITNNTDYRIDRILGVWIAFEDAQQYGIEHLYDDDDWVIHPIDMVNDDRAPRIPHYGGIPVRTVKTQGDFLLCNGSDLLNGETNESRPISTP